MKSPGFRRKLVFALLSISLIAALLLVSCGPKAPEKDVIKIGFSRSLTGLSAAAAEGEHEAVIYWSEKVNAEGGIYVEEYGKKLPVELVFYDDKSSAEEVVRIYERLITVDKVDVLFPPSQTAQNIATISIAEKYHMPMLAATCGSSQGRELGAKYWWAITPIGAVWMDKDKGLAGLINSLKPEIQTVGMLYLIDPWGIECHAAIVPYLTDLGIDIVYDKDYPWGVEDLSGPLLDIKAKNPDAFLGLGYPPDCFLTVKQSAEIGLNPKFMYFLIGPANVAFYPVVGAASEGICGMGMYCGALNYPGAQEFYDGMIERWGHPPDLLLGADGFHAATLMQQAIERAGTLDPEKIRDVLATEEFLTIEGPVRLRDGVNELAVPGVIQWQEGLAQTVWPPEMATTELTFPKPQWP
jgi:branched-chain amino acid transport system substrate-binding protein